MQLLLVWRNITIKVKIQKEIRFSRNGLGFMIIVNTIVLILFAPINSFFSQWWAILFGWWQNKDMPDVYVASQLISPIYIRIMWQFPKISVHKEKFYKFWVEYFEFEFWGLFFKWFYSFYKALHPTFLVSTCVALLGFLRKNYFLLSMHSWIKIVNLVGIWVMSVDSI